MPSIFVAGISSSFAWILACHCTADIAEVMMRRLMLFVVVQWLCGCTVFAVDIRNASANGVFVLSAAVFERI